MRRSVAVIALLQVLAASSLVSQARTVEPYSLALGAEARQPRIRPAPLKESYRIKLASDWPQLSLAGTACLNGGGEVITGTLRRTASGYEGRLDRQTNLQFCGAHGSLSPAPCSLTLTSRGPVYARGEVVLDGEAPTLHLRWGADGGGRTSIKVQGDCAPVFQQSLENLYLSATRALEIPLPAAGDLGIPVRLEDFGWIVAVW